MTRSSRTLQCGVIVVFLLGLRVPAAQAQEFRGSITGTVSDKSAAVLPGVTVTGTNVDTGIGTTAITNADGGYLLPFLTPGSYSVTAELMGFKKLVRQGVAVRIGDRLTLDLALEVGAIAEVVSVTAESPLLDTLSASQGQVIDEKRIALLPLSDGNAFTLARLAPGVAYTGDLKFSRPFDNGGTSGIVSDGASGGNEFTLDGTPNMASGRRVAFVPPAGAVSEFKVETASFDAQQGHTAGATVNVMIKSGTNALKGEGYWYYRDDKLSKNDFFLEDAGRPKAAMSYDRFGGFTGGPILKNRTFFFAAVEWLYDEFPEPGQFTVPTEKMRNGDFSELLAAGITIYDPATAVRRADGRIERQPFPGNIVPASRISPIAREYMQYWPLPNQAGDNQQRNNFLSSNPRTDDFYSVSLRGDHRISSTQSLFVRYTRNDRQEARGNWAGEVNGIRPIGNFLYRVNDGFTGDHVWAISPHALLNLRAGWQRFQEPNVRQHEGALDPASLGFPASTAAVFGPTDYLPRFEVGGISVIGENVGGTTVHSIYSFQPTFTRTTGRHTLRGGYDLRLYQETGAGPGRSAGQYDFATNYTRQLDNSPNVTTGQQFAAFLLGQPTGGSIERNAERENWTPYHAIWIQDDWRVSDRLTLNAGLRYEYEGATYDTDNRNVRGFDPDAVLAVGAAAEAAYARDPIPEAGAVGLPRAWRPAVRRRRRTELLEPGHEQLAASRRRGLSDQQQDGAARRLRRLHVALRHRRRPAVGLFAVDQHRAHPRQRADVRRHAGEPVSGRRPGSGRLQPGPQHVRRPPARSLQLRGGRAQRTERALGDHGAARTAPPMAAGARLRRLTRLRPDGRTERQHAPPPVPDHGAGARPGDDQLPHGQRDQPVRRAAAGRRAEQRNDAAPAAAPAAPAVQRHPDLALRRLVELPRAPEPRRASLLPGLYGAVRLHLLGVHRSQLHAELHGRRPLRGRRGRRRAASVRLLGNPGAAVRSWAALGRRNERVRQRADRRLDGDRDRLDPERPSDQLHRSRPQPLLQRRSRRAVGQLFERREPTGLRHLRVLLRRRRGADQWRRGPGEAAQRSAHRARQQRPLLPAPAGQPAQPGAQ